MTARNRFEGCTALVTGGSGGIGSAVCQGLAREGATVVVVDVAEEPVDALVRQLREAGHTAEGHVVDVRDADAVARLMGDVHEAHGGPHLVVTLAGGSLGTPKELDRIGVDDLDLVVDVNVKGTFLVCQAAAPFLREAAAANQPAAIVTTSSIGGRQPSPVTGVPYAASKAAVVGLTKRLARELGPDGVRVNAVAPGLFLTGRLQGMYDAMPDAERNGVLDAIALGRFPELREIVDPVLFLLSDESSYVTGVVLDVNGGRFMPL
ncbi:MAG TPA: SDR family NAD(P)-dependent oxidoreductase [Actinomycetales bacterium]|nr:SDR family NAD(P)-dependent oxidoreductase [Actinomycetales bacterium]